MLDINGVKSAFSSGDFARGNLFEVNLPRMGKNFKFRCKATAIPAGTVGVIELGYQNRKIKIAGDRTYDQWTVTVFNNDNHKSREDFAMWQDEIVGSGTIVSGQVPGSYKSTGTITQFDRNGNPSAEYKISGIWPSAVGEVALAWDDNDALQEFEVTFEFDWAEKSL